MTVLVVGASGHLGGEVSRRYVDAGESVVGTYHRGPGVTDGIDWQPLDIRDSAAVAALVGRVRPKVVISTAYVFGDWWVSADGAAAVAVASARVGARLVHMSTDAVHGGRPEPYLDGDTPTPVGVYGASKAAAETAVKAIDPAAVLVRTSLIIGDAASKQVKLCLDLIGRKVPGALFSDEIRCPLAVEDLAGAVVELAASDVRGTINVAGPEAVTRPSWAAWWPPTTASTRPTCRWARSRTRACNAPPRSGWTAPAPRRS
ncbi:SDR family oxidoreductase [Luedemannella flava]